ncbi:hypothetical protein [Streptomyces sp. NPDC020983]|uniref:hypothetical protein n=1 Tax=Streptomyces sp. NPDC020983 TaxID=3365106 RepID=UPI0037AF5226
MTDQLAQHRTRTATELGLAGNHPDAIAKHLDAYEAHVTARAYRIAASAMTAQGNEDGANLLSTMATHQETAA